MKKGIFSALLATLLAVAFSLSIVSCKKPDAPKEDEAVEEKAPATDEAKKEETTEEAKKEETK
jgi:hypothetical protein